MKLSPQTSNIFNSDKWQLLKNDTSNARHVTGYIQGVYGNLLYKPNSTQAMTDIFNSMYNLGKNSSLTIAQLIEWVELNQGHRIKNKKDFEYIVHTIARIA